MKFFKILVYTKIEEGEKVMRETQKLLQARTRVEESYEIFSMTGDIQDARMLLEDINEYDILLSKEEETEME